MFDYSHALNGDVRLVITFKIDLPRLLEMFSLLLLKLGLQPS
jgi:hypothetical protein